MFVNKKISRKNSADQLRGFTISFLAIHDGVLCFFKSYTWSSSITLDKPKVTKGIVIRKTRQIPFIDQLIAETLLFQSNFTSNSCG